MYLNTERQLLTIILFCLLVNYIVRNWESKYSQVKNILSDIRVTFMSSDKSIGEFLKSKFIISYLLTIIKKVISISLMLLGIDLFYRFFFHFSLVKTVSNDYNLVISSIPRLITAVMNFIHDFNINNIINHELAAVVALGLAIVPIIKNKIWNNEHWFVNSYKDNNDFKLSIINLAKKANLFRLNKIYISNNRGCYLNEISFNKSPFKNLSEYFLIQSESDKLITLKNDEIRNAARQYNLKMYYKKYTYNKKYYSDLIIKQILGQRSNKIQNLYSTSPGFTFKLEDYNDELKNVLDINKWSNEYKVDRLLKDSIITEDEIARFIILNNNVKLDKISITIELEFKRDKKAFIQLHQTQKCSLRNISIKNR